MKSLTAALAVALLAAAAVPALAGSSLNVPLVAAAPSLDPHGAPFGGAVAQLAWDATNGQHANEPATARIESDGKYLYVRFDVSQSEPMMGSGGGDSVAIDLWPSGSSGDYYRFAVGLDGTRAADYSTANTADWQSSASTHPGGYTVTMRIPADIVASTASQVQFSRWIASSGSTQVWSHAGNAQPDDLASAGTMTLASSVGKN